MWSSILGTMTKQLDERFKSITDDHAKEIEKLNNQIFDLSQKRGPEVTDMASEDPKAPKPMDRKDVERPAKFSGNTDQWLKWSRSFRKFLRRQDERWHDILNAVD